MPCPLTPAQQSSIRRLDGSRISIAEAEAFATKSVFATHVMHLVERGEFSLDIPIATQLPQPINTYEPYRDSASLLVSDPAWPTVTPRILLAHKLWLSQLCHD